MTTDRDREVILKAYKQHLSLNATYNALRDDYTKSQVKRVLSEYAPYQITRKTKDPNKFLRVTTSDPNQYQGDLMFLDSSYKRFNSGFNVFLIIINVATRMIFLYPLKNKQTKGVVEAFEKFLDEVTKASVILSDQGSEFVALKKTLKEDNIELITTNKAQSHSRGTSIVERAIRTIKEKIERYLEIHKTKRYIDALPGIVETYNSTVHSSLGKAPNKITEDDIKKNDEENSLENQKVYKQIDGIKPGQSVRIYPFAQRRSEFFV